MNAAERAALVKEALRNAAENGVDQSDWTDEQIAVDLAYCDGELESEDLSDLVAAVRQARAEGIPE